VVVSVTVAIDGNGSSPGGAEPVDLLSRYQEYVERKIASSRATQDTYSLLLDRIASGDVDPKVLERSTNWFWHAYWPDHAEAIADLTMRFLAGVVRLSLEQSRELVDEFAPDVTALSRIEVPEADPADWATWLSQLIDAAERERSAQRRALQSAMEQAAHAEQAGDAAPSSERRPNPSTVTQLAALCFDVLAGLDGVNADLGLRYLRTVIPDDRSDTVELTGALGESVECGFIVSNDQPHPATVRCDVTEVRREDGIGPAFESSAVITPADLQLPPEGSARISCSIPLTELFVPGATYVGELRVLVDAHEVLRIPIHIRATERGSPS
jgi:hypothetical protein